jgi:hypothetical protein
VGHRFQREGLLQEVRGYVNLAVALERGFGVAGDE